MTIDPAKKHAVTTVFLLDEEVAPQLFAQKVALACSRGALHPGDSPESDDEKHNCDASGCGQNHVMWRGKP